jgi:hypothetical protein
VKGGLVLMCIKVRANEAFALLLPAYTTVQVWRRGTDAEPAPPLCFPGDESLIAAKVISAYSQTPGGGPLTEEQVGCSW